MMAQSHAAPVWVDDIRNASRGYSTPFESELYSYRGRLFRVDRIDDDSGDTSWLGEFTDEWPADKPFIDRYEGALLSYTGDYADEDENGDEPKFNGFEVIAEDLGQTCYDPRREYRYWVPCNNHLADLSPDWTREQAIKALCEDRDRLESYGDGWGLMGVRVSLIEEHLRAAAEEDPEEINGSFYADSDSLWGCESDCKDYIREFAVEMMDGLIIGIDETAARNFPQPLALAI